MIEKYTPAGRHDIRTFIDNLNIRDKLQIVYIVSSCQPTSPLMVLLNEDPDALKTEWINNHAKQYHGGNKSACQISFKQTSFKKKRTK